MNKSKLLKALFAFFVLMSMSLMLVSADPIPGPCPDGKPGCITSSGTSTEGVEPYDSTVLPPPVPGPCPDGKPGC